jgi:hypothetical protein
MRGSWPVLAVALFAAACASAAPPASTTPRAGAQSPSPSNTGAAGEPPSAFLAINGAGRHEGELGTYVYGGAGSDAPWLPARSLDAIPIRSGDRLSVLLADGLLVGPWAATIAPAGDDQAERGRAFGRDETVGGLRETVELPAPPAGSWVVMVNLEYGDGTGSGAYFWLVDVR